MKSVMQAREVAYWYGQVVGLIDVTVEVPVGITGLLGPNGAGKSTFMRLLTGQIKPTRGSIAVLGMRPFANRELYRRLGYAPEHDGLYEDMTGLQFVTFTLELHGLRGRVAHEMALASLERVGLFDESHRRTRGYSKGMRQRLRLAQAMAHQPELLILDEPLTGLDPLVRRDMVSLLHSIASEGVNIIISSHILYEVESLTDQIVLIHRGRLLAHGSVSEIRGLLDRYPRKVEIRARRARTLARALIDLSGVTSVRLLPDGEHLVVETEDLDRFVESLPALVTSTEPGILAFRSTDAGLSAVFDYLVN